MREIKRNKMKLFDLLAHIYRYEWIYIFTDNLENEWEGFVYELIDEDKVRAAADNEKTQLLVSTMGQYIVEDIFIRWLKRRATVFIEVKKDEEE